MTSMMKLSLLPATLTMLLAISAPVTAQLRLVPYVSGLESPVGLVPDPTDPARQYVLEREGRIRLVIDGELQATPFLDLTDPVRSAEGEQGLLGLAFAPDYATSRRFFVNFTREPDGYTVIARFERSPTNPDIAEITSRFDLVFQGLPFIAQPAQNHNGGKLLFRADGYLYIAMGDGGGSNDRNNNAQSPTSLLGKILRIDVDVPNENPLGYQVPDDNPFIGDDELGARDEIWAFGLRNPWRVTEDLPALGGTGALLIGDVGQGAREEINYEPVDGGGRNYGWSLFEGTIPTPGVDPNRELAYEPATLPIHDYGRGVGVTVIGGYVYRGRTLGAGSQGRYFFADWSGRVYSLHLVIDSGTGEAEAEDVTEHTSDLFPTSIFPDGPPLMTSVDADAHGELFIVASNRTIYRVTVDDGDDDGDGLPDAWEQQFGLSMEIGSGEDGPYGDPDGDGLSNGEELRRGSNPLDPPEPPTEPLVRLFAEGATNFFFDTELALVNPTTEPTHATLEYRRHDGRVLRQGVDLPAERRVTVDPRDRAGDGALFATSVRSEAKDIVVERSMKWPVGTHYGSHADAGVAAPASTWYLAEGHTAPFSLFYLLDNEGNAPADVEVRYLLPGGAPVVKQYTVAPHSRQTVFVNLEDPALASTAVSAAISSAESTPITVERAMYLDGPDGLLGAGHGTTGVTSPSTGWLFAEGATGDYFDLFLALANPGSEQAQVTVHYLLHGDGRAVSKTYTVEPESRYTIYVDAEEAESQSLANETLSIEVTSDQPILAERAMWWPGPTFDPTWREAHAAYGAPAPAVKWLTAGGENGGPSGLETFVLIGNISAFDGLVRVTLLFEDEDPWMVELPVAARSRVSLPIRPEEGWPVGDKRFGVLVESLSTAGGQAELIVERASYSNAQGIVWAAGENTLATPVP